MAESKPLVQIKGLRDGLMVTLRDAPWSELQEALQAQIDSQPAFFEGARVALDVGEQELKVKELSALRDMLSEHGIFLWAMLSESSKTKQTAQNLGLATRITKPQPMETPVDDQDEADRALWLEQTVRSGARIEHPGHIVVMGDVNPGAEIVAGGSIIVWGRLRGVVHAGAEGDEECYVAALELAPTQLRIAGEIATTPEKVKKVQPEVVSLKEGKLIAEPWNKT